MNGAQLVVAGRSDFIQPLPTGGLADEGERIGLIQLVNGEDLDAERNGYLVERGEHALDTGQHTRSAEAQEERMRLALASLSPREREVLDQLVRGQSNKNIADQLGITPRTVEFHRANIFEKMGVSSAVELAHKLGRLQALAVK